MNSVVSHFLVSVFAANLLASCVLGKVSVSGSTNALKFGSNNDASLYFDEHEKQFVFEQDLHAPNIEWYIFRLNATLASLASLDERLKRLEEGAYRVLWAREFGGVQKNLLSLIQALCVLFFCFVPRVSLSPDNPQQV